MSPPAETMAKAALYVAMGESGISKMQLAYDSVGAARASIAQYLDWYNSERPHSSLDRTTPDTVYQELLPKLSAAA